MHSSNCLEEEQTARELQKGTFCWQRAAQEHLLSSRCPADPGSGTQPGNTTGLSCLEFDSSTVQIRSSGVGTASSWVMSLHEVLKNITQWRMNQDISQVSYIVIGRRNRFASIPFLLSHSILVF